MKQTNLDPFFEVLDRDTYFDYDDRYIRCYNYHTIAREIRFDEFEVFSIPKTSWKLITYLESVEKADILAKRLFEKPSLLDNSLKFEYTYNGTTGAQCFMKFWDEDLFIDPINYTDVWLPLVCISNNYDGSGALHYDFGFQIKGFQSNIIFEDFNINLKVNHTSTGKKNIAKNLQDHLDNIKFESKTDFINKFIERIKKIIDKSLGKSDIFPLFLKFIDADIKLNSRQKTKDAFCAIKTELKHLFSDCDKLDVYNFMKIVSYFIENTKTLSAIIHKEKNDDDEELEEEPISNKPQELSYKMKLKLQKQLGSFINKIIKETIEHKNEKGESKTILIKDWVGEKYYNMANYI